jgi:pyruvate/2-oxoglutarate dehydrogenase complex dihydrolipoamide dehydrogenase (E3) component
VVINTGTRAKIDPIPGLAEAEPLTHVEALELDHLPQHLLVLGGGYVGLEFAQAMRRFGSQVTIIERNASVAHREDEDVRIGLQQLCDAEGINVLTNTRVERVEGRSGISVRLEVTRDGAKAIIDGSHLLAAAGRVPNTDAIGLELAGVTLDVHGFVQVDETLRTTADHVWAVGDCAGSPQFTHIGFDDYRVVRDNMLGIRRVTTGRLVPYCLFTDPELARVGLSELEAKSRGVSYRLTKITMAEVLRTWALSEKRGFMKALIDTRSDRILGFTAFGTEAGEVMAVVQLAISAGIPYTVLRDSIITHPTMAEGLVTLFSAVPAQ